MLLQWEGEITGHCVAVKHWLLPSNVLQSSCFCSGGSIILVSTIGAFSPQEVCYL